MSPRSNYVYAVLVICAGIVVSFWLFERNPDNSRILEKAEVIATKTDQNDENISDDWKKIIVSTDTNQTYTNLTKNNTKGYDDTTVTAQLSKDLFSQYLLAKQGGANLTQDQVNQIVNNIINTKYYSSRSGPTYIAQNLHLISQDNTDTIRHYKDTVNLILKTRSTEVHDNPLTVLSNALQNQKQSDVISRLDAIISIGNAGIKDLLAVSVPPSAVAVHLGLVNAFSNIISNLSDMRMIFSDPARSLSGMSQYTKNIQELNVALNNLNNYFSQKLGL